MAAINHPLGGHADWGRRLGLSLGRPNWWVLGGIAIVGLSALLPVLQNATVTSEGFSMERSQGKEAQLNGQISVLESEIAAMTSLQRVEQRARQLGLHPAQNPAFVHIDVPGPAPAKLPAQYLPSPTPTPATTESWWHSLLNALPLPH